MQFRERWKSYKELMEKATRSMGFKIGFLFDDNKKFGEGLNKLRMYNPRLRAGFEEFLEQTREEWQNELAKFRNTWLEHQMGDKRQFEKFYRPQYAEALFILVWRTIVDILPYYWNFVSWKGGLSLSSIRM